MISASVRKNVSRNDGRTRDPRRKRCEFDHPGFRAGFPQVAAARRVKTWRCDDVSAFPFKVNVVPEFVRTSTDISAGMGEEDVTTPSTGKALHRTINRSMLDLQPFERFVSAVARV